MHISLQFVSLIDKVPTPHWQQNKCVPCICAASTHWLILTSDSWLHHIMGQPDRIVNFVIRTFHWLTAILNFHLQAACLSFCLLFYMSLSTVDTAEDNHEKSFVIACLGVTWTLFVFTNPRLKNFHTPKIWSIIAIMYYNKYRLHKIDSGFLVITIGTPIELLNIDRFV